MIAFKRAFRTSSKSSNFRAVENRRIGILMCLFLVTGMLFMAACQDQRGLPGAALDWSKPPSAPLDVMQASIQGDSLVVQVAYSGGCAEHAFELVTAGPQLRSLPPKQPLMIAHETNGDACRSRIEEILAFDLRPHRMSPTGLTVILFNDSTLMYRYE